MTTSPRDHSAPNQQRPYRLQKKRGGSATYSNFSFGGSATKLRSWFVLRTLSKEATSRVALQQDRLRRSWHIICCANRYKNVCYTCVCDLTSLHCTQAQRGQLLRMSRSQACVCTLCWGLMLPKSPPTASEMGCIAERPRKHKTAK
jgi:hypothetical protein